MKWNKHLYQSKGTQILHFGEKGGKKGEMWNCGSVFSHLSQCQCFLVKPVFWIWFRTWVGVILSHIWQPANEKSHNKLRLLLHSWKSHLSHLIITFQVMILPTRELESSEASYLRHSVILTQMGNGKEVKRS